MEIIDDAQLFYYASAYKEQKIYSIFPTDGNGNFPYSRTLKATRVNQSGLIEEVEANIPRLDYSEGDCPSLLIEPSKTNYIQRSQEFSNSYWSKLTSDSTVNPIVTGNFDISPAGVKNADRVQLTAPADNEYSVIIKSGLNTNTPVNGKLQQSIYLKANNINQVGKNVDIYVYDATNTTYKTVFNYTLTNEWQRVVVEHTITGNTTTNVQFAFGKARATAGGSTQNEVATDFLVWGGQLEKSDFVTSYIPTTSQPVTRQNDNIVSFSPGYWQELGGIPYIDANGNSSADLYNDTEGVLFFEMKPISLDNTKKTITLSSGYLNDRIVLGYNSNGSLIANVYNNGSFQSVLGGQTEDIGNFNKIALKYKQNDFALYINGSRVNTDSTGTTFGSNVLKILRFSGVGGNNKFFGKIRQFKYFNTALTNEDLINLTS